MREKNSNLFIFTCFLLTIQTVHSNRYSSDIAPLDDEDFNPNTGSGDGPDDRERFNVGFTPPDVWNVTTVIPNKVKGNALSTRWPPYSYTFFTTPSSPFSSSSSFIPSERSRSRSQIIASPTPPTTTTTSSPVTFRWPQQDYVNYIYDRTTKNYDLVDRDLVSIRVYPTSQIIYTTQEVVIRCRDESYRRLPVIWSRSDGGQMSPEAIDRSGRLVIPNIKLSDAGEYKCSPIDQNYRYLYANTSKVLVFPIESLRSQQIVPNYESFQCSSDNLKVCPGSTNCIPKTYFCDGESDCPGERDEDNCESCKLYEFRCRNGQCIDKSRRCDGLTDCRDGSDEINCNDDKRNVLPLQLSIVPPYMDVEKGAFVQFACASSDPNARLAWVFEQGELPRTASVLGGTLTIRNAQEMDQGTYICMGTDPYGTKAETQARLTVRRPQSMVTVNIIPRYIEVEEGGNVVLSCNSSLSTNQYSWTFNRGAIPPGAEVINNQLRIRSANQRHSGHYMCNVRTQFGVGEAIALVTINQVSTERRPAMLVQPSHAEVPLGGSVRFLCNATDPRPAQIIWQFRRGPLPSGAVQVRELLTISPVTEAHYGEYHCLVSNSYGRNQQTVELHRPGGGMNQGGSQNQHSPSSVGPSIEVQPAGGLSVEIGDYARLECRSHEVEPNDLQWLSASLRLPEGATSDKGILVIPSVSAIHYGVYACEATNSYGTSRKVVEIRRPSLNPNISPVYQPATGPIDATIEPQQQTIVQGNSGILRCMVTGVPSASIIWSKVNGVLTERHRIDGEIMRIENAVISDRGLYVCKVESPSGTVVAQGSAIVEIEPREPPIVEIYPSVTQSIPIGGSALFQCRLVAGIPEPKIHWTRADNSPLTPNTETVEGGVIRFLRVTGSEEGIYKCTAENIAGRVEYEVTLRIERNEAPIDPVRPSYPVRPSEPSYNPDRPEYPPRPSSKVSVKISQRSPLVIKEGEPLMLDCIADGVMDVQLIWMNAQKGQYITQSAVRRNVYKKYDSTPEDSGEYRCYAHSPSGTVDERIQVVVEPVGGSNLPHRYPQPSVPSHSTPYESIRNVTLGAGGSTEIKCHASGLGLASPVMIWTRESGPLPVNSYQRDGTLFIDTITVENSGTYSCTGRGSSGEIVAVQRVLLNVHGRLPALHLEPISQVVSVGQRVSINCILPGATTEKITWNREGSQMSPRTRIIRGELIFTDISPTDTGSYICKASTPEGGEARAVAHVQVGSSASSDSHSYPSPSPPTPSPVRPSYPSYPTNYETRPPQGKREIVDQMSTKTLSCDFRRLPNFVIRWEFNNKNILPPNVMSYGNDIVLSNIDKNNEGRYICNAHLPGSERPIDRDYIDLIVRDAESCTAYEFRCYDNSCIDRELRCDGRPDCRDGSDEQYCPDSRQSYPRPPDTRSRYPSDPRSNYPSYPSQPAPYSDARYQPQQPVQVDVKIEPNKLLVTVGDDLELRCHADGPDYRYEWFKDTQPVRNENIEINHNVLTIKNVKSENGGVYTCRARNRYGFGTDEHVVMIQRVSPHNEIRIVESDLGSSVGLDCPRTIPGAAYTWTRPNDQLPKETEIINDRLIVRNVKPNYAGQYECTAKSPQGSAVSFISLVVKKVIPRFRREYNSHIKLSTIPEPDKSFDIEIAVKPDYSEGLILYTSGPAINDQQNQNFISLSLTRGFIEYRIQTGSAGLIKLKSTKPLPLNEWTKVVITKDGPNVVLLINDVAEAPVTLTGDNLDLKLGEPLYIGGVPSSALINSQAGSVDGLIGCMSILKIKGRSVLMVDEGELFGVSSCTTCSSEVCSGHGACHEDATVTTGFRCICHPGFSGSNCSANVDACKEGSCGLGKCINRPEGGYDCYCPYGRTGLRCEREITIRTPSFGGKSFAAYPSPKPVAPETKPEVEAADIPDKPIPQLALKMRVKPNPEKEGLIMYSGQDDSGKNDFAAIAIKNKAIEFSFDAGSGPAFIRSAPLENFDEYVTFKVSTHENIGVLTVNGKDYSETAPGPTKSLHLETPVYIGGFDQQKIKLPRSLNISHGFDGCIAHVEVNGVAIDFASQVLDAANVDDCGPHDSCAEANQQCQNGGTCQVELCLCPADFTGHRCETSINKTQLNEDTGITPNETLTTQLPPKSTSQPMYDIINANYTKRPEVSTTEDSVSVSVESQAE